ncbi:MAG: hypothetical protein ABIH92_02445 [Nanoarchaeota archaeon]
MDNVKIAKTLTRLAGALLGPGIPDGTGPYGGTPRCQLFVDEEEVVNSQDEEEQPQTFEVDDLRARVASDLVKLARMLVKSSQEGM